MTDGTPEQHANTVREDTLASDLKLIRQTRWAIEEPGPSRGEFDRAVGRVAALAERADTIAKTPDMARLLIDMGEALQKTIYNPPGWTGPDVWWNDEAKALLARLDALGKEPADG